MEAPSTASEIFLIIAFFPLVFGVARLLHPSLKPPRHRPLACVAGSVFALILGTLSAYALRSPIQSGIFHHSSRHFGEFYAEITHQPFEFWCLVLVMYGIGVFISGFGLAAIVLCFRQGPGQ